jgi:predicted dehydrogenase
MKQIFQNFRNGRIELLEIPSPVAQPGFVLVKNRFSLLSLGTERAGLAMAKKSLLAKAASRPDLAKQVLAKLKSEGLFSAYRKTNQRLGEAIPLGYSCAGEVIAVGPGLRGFEKGERVAGGGQGYAAHAEIVALPKNLCLKIPGKVSFEAAAFVSLGAIALQGIRRAGLSQGEKVGLIGLGLIGQLTLQMLKAYGFPVIGFDVNSEKVKRGLASGLEKGGLVGVDDLESMVNAFTGNLGLDAVIVAAASKSSQPIELAARLLREKGRVSVVGDVGLNVPRRLYYKKEIDLLISRSYGPGRYDKEYEEKGNDYPLAYVRWTEKRNMGEFLRLAAEGLVQPETLVTDRFPLGQAIEAYDLVSRKSGRKETLAVLFDYKQEIKSEKTLFLEKDYRPLEKDEVAVGLIGAGNFAQAVILPNLKKIGRARLMAVADLRGEKAQKMAKKFGGRYATTDYQKIIDDKEIDLVIVSTRHRLHAEIAVAALNNNKNVYLEKPLALKQEELSEIVLAAASSSGRLMVGFNRRFAPFSLKAKELFQGSSGLTMLYRINAGFLPLDHWARDPEEGGGRIIGEVCHFVDLLQFFAGSPPKKVWASAVPPAGEAAVDDNFAVAVDFENNSRAVILYTSLGPKSLAKEYIEIYGNGQAIIIDDFKKARIFNKKGTKVLRQWQQDKGHRRELEELIGAISRGKPSPIPFKELVYSTRAVFAIKRSIKEGRPVEIFE